MNKNDKLILRLVVVAFGLAVVILAGMAFFWWTLSKYAAG